MIQQGLSVALERCKRPQLEDATERNVTPIPELPHNEHTGRVVEQLGDSPRSEKGYRCIPWIDHLTTNILVSLTKTGGHEVIDVKQLVGVSLPMADRSSRIVFRADEDFDFG
jgi:hypothetical protein